MKPTVSAEPVTDDWPVTLGLIWVVYFFVAFLFYASMTRNGDPYGWPLFEGLFVAAVAARLWWEGRIADMRHYLLGRLLPVTRSIPLAAGLLAFTVFAFYLLAWLHPGHAIRPTLNSVVNVVVMAPMQEELVFRGILLTILLAHGKGPRWWLVLVSALLFASCHLVENWRYAVRIVILGSIAGAALVGTRSIAVCISIHGLWNVMGYCPFMFRLSEASPWAEPSAVP